MAEGQQNPEKATHKNQPQEAQNLQKRSESGFTEEETKKMTSTEVLLKEKCALFPTTLSFSSH